MFTELRMDIFEQVCDSVCHGIIAINREGRIVLFNKTACDLIGIAREKALNEKIEIVIPNTQLLDTMESGQTECSKHMVINARSIVTNRSPIIVDGRIVGAIAIFQDISELEKLSQQLQSTREMNKELDAIIDSVDDGIVVADGNGYIIRINEGYQRITGHTTQEYVGQHCLDLIKQGYSHQSISKLVLERKSRTTIIDVRNNKELLMTANPVFNDSGDLVRVVTVIRDIDELDQLKQQLKLSEQLKAKYLEELEHIRSQKHIITRNPVMQARVNLAFQIAKVDSIVLIQGETGVGKELVAHIVHRASKRAQQPFLQVNCGAIPAQLLESELFGYEPGAFTGAAKGGKIGLFELAQGGSLFLDEVSELPLNMQVKLLRTIQEKEITRLGGTKTIKLDVRIIAASNRDLQAMVREHSFRQDLYYRLNVVPIVIPPLRDRKEDIPFLAAEFLDTFNKRYDFQKWLHADAMKIFLKYDWPGNIRELQNTIERLVVTSNQDCITVGDLENMQFSLEMKKSKDITNLRKIYEEEEKRLLAEAYHQAKSTYRVAEVLGISQTAVMKKMKKYGLKASDK
ncbi:MAG: sigma 54-interacting transcriptional regulator [Negativicutes bacterium]|nr:sigma 54-interacting transcriptional regulator [Negativicutes bacterium]